MKKALILGGALTLVSSLPAAAQIVIQSTIVTPGAPVYYAQPEPYPVYYDRHHHYDWRYWHEERDGDDYDRGRHRGWDRGERRDRGEGRERD